MPDLLDNPRADRVKRVRGLFRASGRRRAGQYPAEGPQAVREAVRYAPVSECYVSESAARRHADILAVAREREVAVRLATDEVVAAMSPDAQGLLAVVDLAAARMGEGEGASAHQRSLISEHPAIEPSPGPGPRPVCPVGPLPASHLPSVLATRPQLIAVFSQMQDPGNAGTAIRAADAAGADAVVLTAGSVEPTNPKVVRASAGSLFHLPVIVGADAADTIAQLSGGGLRVLAADAHGEAALDEFIDAARGGADGGDAAPLGPVAWLFGNEAHGLGDLAGSADAAIRIPMPGRAESLNLAQAATLCLFATAYAQRHA